MAHKIEKTEFCRIRTSKFKTNMSKWYENYPFEDKTQPTIEDLIIKNNKTKTQVLLDEICELKDVIKEKDHRIKGLTKALRLLNKKAKE